MVTSKHAVLNRQLISNCEVAGKAGSQHLKRL